MTTLIGTLTSMGKMFFEALLLMIAISAVFFFVQVFGYYNNKRLSKTNEIAISGASVDMTNPIKHASALIFRIINLEYLKKVLTNHYVIYHGDVEQKDCEEYEEFLTTRILETFDD